MGHGATTGLKADEGERARLSGIERRLASLERRLLQDPGESGSARLVTVGELLRRRRRHLHHTQAAAALSLGVNQATVSKWERGGRISWDHAADVAAYLDLPPVVVLAHNP